MCKGDEETVKHLFGICPLTRLIWDYFWVFSDIGRSSSTSLMDRIKQGENQALSKLGRIYWSMIFHVITWTIWCERNKRGFKGKKRSLLQIICDVKELIWGWGLGCSEGKLIKQDVAVCNWDRLMTL